MGGDALRRRVLLQASAQASGQPSWLSEDGCIRPQTDENLLGLASQSSPVTLGPGRERTCHIKMGRPIPSHGGCH